MTIDEIKAQALGILNCSQVSQSRIHEAIENIPALCDEVQRLTAHVEKLQDDMKGVEDGIRTVDASTVKIKGKIDGKREYKKKV